MNFREQMLAPAMSQLDDIASTFIREINAAHAKGMDMREAPGKALFASQPCMAPQVIAGALAAQFGRQGPLPRAARAAGTS